MIRLFLALVIALVAAGAPSAQRGMPGTSNMPVGIEGPNGFHLPEGSEDYCNRPDVYCAEVDPNADPDDDDPDDDDSDASNDGTRLDGITQAADAVGDVINDDRENGSLLAKVIIRIADIMGPNIPTDPGAGDGDGSDDDGGKDPDEGGPDGGGPDEGGPNEGGPNEGGPTEGEEPTTLAFVVGGDRAASNALSYFSEMRPGDALPVSGADGEVQFMSIDEAPNRKRGAFVVSLRVKSDYPEYMLVYFDGKWAYILIKGRWVKA